MTDTEQIDDMDDLEADFGDANQHRSDQAEPASTDDGKKRKDKMQKKEKKKSGFAFKRFLLTLILCAAGGYYGGGAVYLTNIDDDVAFVLPKVENNTNITLRTAASLIDREISRDIWPPNQMFFSMGYMMDNMPHFQMEMIRAIGWWISGVNDFFLQEGRVRADDEDLNKATDLLSGTMGKKGADIAVYRQVIGLIEAHNKKLQDFEISYVVNETNIAEFMAYIAGDLDHIFADMMSYRYTRNKWLPYHLKADDMFYSTKGRLYAYAILFRALDHDIKRIIDGKGLGKEWEDTLKIFNEAALLSPMWVSDGAPDNPVFPNHLMVQGMYMLRLSERLRFLANNLGAVQ